MKKLFTFILITLVFIFLGFSFNKNVNASNTYIVKNPTTLTQSAEYELIIILDDLVISNNSTLMVNNINISKGCSITIEEGSTLNINDGYIKSDGEINVKGTFYGKVGFFQMESGINILDDGVVNLYFDIKSSFNDAFKMLEKNGNAVYQIENTIYAVSDAHVHEYNTDGICTKCHFASCVIGDSDHNMVGNMCTRCRLGAPDVTIIKSEYKQIFDVIGYVTIKSGVTITTNTVLIYPNGKLIIEEGATLIVNGDFDNGGTLDLKGFLRGNIDNFMSYGEIITSKNCLISLTFPSYINAIMARYMIEQSGIELTINDSIIFYSNGTHTHNYVNGVCSDCGLIDPSHRHTYNLGVCTICGYECHHNFDNNNICKTCKSSYCDLNGGHNFINGKCIVCEQKCENEFHNHQYACPDCGMSFDTKVTGSVISGGSLALIIGISAAAIFFVLGIFFEKKRKQNIESGNDE